MQAPQYSTMIQLPAVLFYFILLFGSKISLITLHRYNGPAFETGLLPVNATYSK